MMLMISTGVWPLQMAIYQRLNDDTALNNVITGVYDEVSEQAVFPYVATGEPVINPFVTKNEYREEIPWTLHGWSNYNGKKEAMQILNLMMQALTREPLQVDGYKVNRVEIEPNSQVIPDINEGTYHAILRVRFFIEKN